MQEVKWLPNRPPRLLSLAAVALLAFLAPAKMQAVRNSLRQYCAHIAAPAAEPAREKPAIEKVIRANIGWALTKDRPLLERTMLHDERLFIINPDSETTAGWGQFVKNFDFWMDPRFKATKSDIRDLRIDVSPSGVTAWWSCVLDDLGEWDGKPIGWKDTRWTGVLEKRSGKWLIVQMHFSFAADKVAAALKAKLAKEAAPPPPDKE